jgi:alpha-beta hydrolase superfamily lysophospholipase/membrane protease YdiL (CAAX protease family)
MKTFDDTVTLETIGMQGAPLIPLSLARRILLHWVVRFLITWFAFGLLTWASIAGLEALSIEIGPMISVGVLAVCSLLAVFAVTRLIERRNLAEIGLSVRRFVMDWLKGAGVGAAYLCASVSILALLGGYRMTGVIVAGQALAGGLLLHVLVGVFEETLFRGILFRFLEEGFGSWIALSITALFFGLSHLSNPNATLWSAIAIALEAGVAFGAVYMATRSLWVAMGMHTAWNFLQGNIFGVAVSGNGAPTDSLFQPLIQGNPWLTGGAFGIEASVIAVVLGLGLGSYLLVQAVRQNRIMRGLLWSGGINVLKSQSFDKGDIPMNITLQNTMKAGNLKRTAPNLIRWAGLSAMVAGIIFIAGLAAAIAFGGPTAPPTMTSISNPFDTVDFSDLPPLLRYTAGDGEALAYRHYGAASGTVQGSVVLVHGSSANSNSMHLLAKAFAAAGYDAYALDMRGHGASGTKGRIDYIGQLEDDLAAFTGAVLLTKPATLVGFSSGGGFVLRVAGSPRQDAFQNYLLLSPFLSVDAPNARPGGGGWVNVGLPRIIALTILNRLGIRAFHDLPVTSFALREETKKSLTPTYSFSLAVNFGPQRDYAANIRAVHRPVAVVAGTADEVFLTDKLAAIFRQQGQPWSVTLLPGIGHIALTLDPRAGQAAVRAVEAFPQ